MAFEAHHLAAAFAALVRRHLDLMTGVFMVRQLPPWFENLGKRQVKAPKVYIRDSGMLHGLLHLASLPRLEEHPKLGASWEGFALEQVLQVSGGLCVVERGKRWAFDLALT